MAVLRFDRPTGVRGAMKGLGGYRRSAVAPQVRTVPAVSPVVGYFAGATCTRITPLELMLWMRTRVPVLGTLTPYQPGWYRPT
jgi:hypothetical protein